MFDEVCWEKKKKKKKNSSEPNGSDSPGAFLASGQKNQETRTRSKSEEEEEKGDQGSPSSGFSQCDPGG